MNGFILQCPEGWKRQGNRRAIWRNCPRWEMVKPNLERRCHCQREMVKPIFKPTVAIWQLVQGGFFPDKLLIFSRLTFLSPVWSCNHLEGIKFKHGGDKIWNYLLQSKYWGIHRLEIQISISRPIERFVTWPEEYRLRICPDFCSNALVILWKIILSSCRSWCRQCKKPDFNPRIGNFHIFQTQTKDLVILIEVIIILIEVIIALQELKVLW